MAKVVISGDDHPTHVSQEEAERILDQKEDSSFKGMIAVGDRRLQKRQIKEVVFGSVNTAGKYDLNNQEDRRVIREFESKLNAYCIEQEGLVNKAIEEGAEVDLSYFGETMEKSSVESFRKNPYFVRNELFGVVHFAVVKFAEKESAILRTKRGDWCIANHSWGGEKADVSIYISFMAKYEALQSLIGRRAFAEKRDREAEQQLLNDRGSLAQEKTVAREKISTDSDLF